jgi:hypothetical protein
MNAVDFISRVVLQKPTKKTKKNLPEASVKNRHRIRGTVGGAWA